MSIMKVWDESCNSRLEAAVIRSPWRLQLLQWLHLLHMYYFSYFSYDICITSVTPVTSVTRYVSFQSLQLLHIYYFSYFSYTYVSLQLLQLLHMYHFSYSSYISYSSYFSRSSCSSYEWLWKNARCPKSLRPESCWKCSLQSVQGTTPHVSPSPRQSSSYWACLCEVTPCPTQGNTGTTCIYMIPVT